MVVPRLYDGDHAFILQNDDRRVVFMIPFERRLHARRHDRRAAVDSANRAQASVAEVDYLCRAVNRYLAKPVAPRDVRLALRRRASAVRRRLERSVGDHARLHAAARRRCRGRPRCFRSFGGKITTYRRLAEHVLERLASHFPAMQGPWTAGVDASRERVLAAQPPRGTRYSSALPRAARAHRARRVPPPRRGSAQRAGRRASSASTTAPG